jgi:hypothetical protein
MKLYLLALISLLYLPFSKSGAATPICAACSLVCIVPLSPICISCLSTICLWGVTLSACFNSDTKISKIENGQINEVSIYDLKKNDLVLANNNNKLTRVVRNVKSEGIFDYIQVISESGKELTITNEHGIIIYDDDSNTRIIKANNLKIGQKLITLDGPEIIKNIKSLKLENKYILETEDGTVIANNIYVSTICDDMIDETINSDDLLKHWKDKHEKLYQKIINN